MPDVVKVVVADRYYAEGFGEVGSGRELSKVTFIGVGVIIAALQKRVPVCAFAQRHLRAGVGWCTRDGMFHLVNETRHVVYELFPVEFDEDRPNTVVTVDPTVYLGVMRSDDRHL